MPRDTVLKRIIIFIIIISIPYLLIPRYGYSWLFSAIIGLLVGTYLPSGNDWLSTTVGYWHWLLAMIDLWLLLTPGSDW